MIRKTETTACVGRDKIDGEGVKEGERTVVDRPEDQFRQTETLLDLAEEVTGLPKAFALFQPHRFRDPNGFESTPWRSWLPTRFKTNA